MAVFDQMQLTQLLQSIQQLAQGAGQAGPAAAPAEARLRDDLRHVDKPQRFEARTFEEEQEKWDDWKHVFLNYLCMMDEEFTTELEQVNQNRAQEPKMDNITPAQQKRSNLLYAYLSSFVRGRLLGLVKKHRELRNGFAAWHELLQELEPQERGRGLALLVGLVSEDNWPKSGEFLDQIRSWEEMVRQYTLATTKDLPDDLKIAVVLRHAPGEIGRHLRLQADAGLTYPQLQAKIREFYMTTRSWLPRPGAGHVDTGGVAPMEVDAIAALQSAVNALSSKGKGGGKKGASSGRGKGSGNSTGGTSSSWTSGGGKRTRQPRRQQHQRRR